MRTEPEILHVRSSAGLYGAEYVLLGLVPALQRLGVTSRLLCLENPYLQQTPLHARAQQLGVPTQLIPCSGRFDMSTVRTLRREIAQHPNAIVHVHDYKSALHVYLASAGRGWPIVATAHGHFATSFKLRAYERLEIWLMRSFAKVCIVSEAMRPILSAAGIAPERIELIENGIDTERFRADIAAWPRCEFELPADAVVFGSAMRLNEQKNPLGLIEAFAIVTQTLPNAMLLIAGEGPLREAIALRCAQLGLTDCARLIGARNDLEHFYPLLDVFVLPSWYEGLPLSLLEAMAAATPIVATAVGQVPEVLRGLPGAEPIAAGDVDALAQAMIVAARQPQRAGLRERVVERYSVVHMARAYQQLYLTLGCECERAAA